MKDNYDPRIRVIPTRQINVLNPRERGKKKFAQIVANISKLGLKKPVTVAQATEKNGEPRYDLVCGQGRLEAYIELGATEIPAIIVSGSKEDLLLMSLAENLARRAHSTVELVREIGALKNRGYSHLEIAKKTDLDAGYVRGISQLLNKGEERLLSAVEKGQLPLNVALTIATSDDKSVQLALQEAYEKHDLRGRALIRARQLVETRRSRGKRPRRGVRPVDKSVVSTEGLLRTYQQETIRQRMVIQKAKICETRLLFAVSALKQLFASEHFVALTRAEGLDTLPKYLADQVLVGGEAI